MNMLRARAVAHEYLDEPTPPEDLRINLREMAMLNRLPGGVADSVRAVSGALDGRTRPCWISAGSGDFARRLLRARRATVLVADVHPEVLAITRRNLANTNGVKFLRADVRALPLADDAVDVVHASLLLHLDPRDAVIALREMRRVAREAVVVNDLRRGRRVRYGGGPRAGVHPGPIHPPRWRPLARRAYTLAELDDLARPACVVWPAAPAAGHG